MTTVSIVLAIALFVLLRSCMKWGFVTAIRWAGLLGMGLPLFWFSGWLAMGFLKKAGVNAPPVRAWLVIGCLVALVAWQIAKRTGWSKVLGGLYMVALCLSGVVVVLFNFLLFGVLIHATVPALIFIAVLTVILMGVSHGYQTRGR
jgi:hypothetical protein